MIDCINQSRLWNFVWTDSRWFIYQLEVQMGFKYISPPRGVGGEIILEQQIWFCKVLFVSHLKSIEDILCRSKYWGSLKFEGLDASFFNDIWRCAAILSKEKQTYYNQEAKSRFKAGKTVTRKHTSLVELWRSSKFQGLRVSSSKRNTYYIRHRIRLTREYEVDKNTRREIALVFSFGPSWFPRPFQ